MMTGRLLLILLVSVICCHAKGENLSKIDGSRQLNESPGHYHNRMYGYNASVPGAHKKAWMVLETVNGLKNEDVVMLVTSTSQKHFVYLRERSVYLSLNK